MGLGWRPVSDPGMPPAPIVEDFDVFEQCRFGLPPGAELCSMNKFGLERAEERLHRRIVIESVCRRQALISWVTRRTRRRERIEMKAISMKATRCSVVRSKMVFNRR